MSEPLIPPHGLRPMMCAGTCGFEIGGYVEPTWCYDCLEKRVVAAESALAALQAKCRDLGWPEEEIVVPIEEEPR